jgi:hypothetical protein
MLGSEGSAIETRSRAKDSRSCFLKDCREFADSFIHVCWQCLFLFQPLVMSRALKKVDTLLVRQMGRIEVCQRISFDNEGGIAAQAFSIHLDAADIVAVDGGDHVLTLNQWRALSGNEANDDHSFVATAAELFQAAAASDFHLNATSPAINAGTTLLAPTIDLDGKHRPIGAAIDVGAYEFGLITLDGDFNLDGIVDAADYTVWRDGLDVGFTPDQYALWKAHYGDSQPGPAAGSAAAVPDPATAAILMAIGLAAALLRVKSCV